MALRSPKALNYALNRWEALLRYTQDGHLEIDNNIAERSVRGCLRRQKETTCSSDRTLVANAPRSLIVSLRHAS